MTVPVIWKSYIDSPARGYWDTTLLDWMFEQKMPGGFQFEHRYDFPGDIAQGIVLVTPGHWRDATQLNEDIRGRPWVLLIVTSDEEGLAPIHLVQHPNLSVWKHTPRAELPWQPDRVLPLGWSPGTVEANRTRPDKDGWGLDWFFTGQITHDRREEAARVMRGMANGKLVETDHFIALDQGMGREEYFDHMRRAKVIPCPSGPMIPDTFRLYEALESGAVPLADATCPRGDWGYWGRAWGHPAFPIVEDWKHLPELVDEWKDQTKRIGVLAWWERAKRDLLWRLHDDIANLGADKPKVRMEERVTVVMPTSPIPSHPSTEIIEQTLKSIRERLPHSEILIMCDGVRPELEHRREAYTQYLERLIWLCRQYRAVPLLHDFHRHQIGMMWETWPLIKSDLILYVEHDTPLVGEIPFEALGDLLLDDRLRVARFYHETAIPREHRYLMEGVAHYNGIRFMRTHQWSQRPHLTTTDNYLHLLKQYLPVQSNSMVEDKLYGHVANADWAEFKVGIYFPAGDLKRSEHLDGRGSDSKYEELMR